MGKRSRGDATPRAVDPDGAVDAHTALLRTNVGQAVVAILVAIMALWIVGPNIPASPMRDKIDVAWSPAINAGFDQNWAVFSPNPRSQSLLVRANIEYDDGTSTVWEIPDFDPFVGAYRGYRWRKWQERVRLDDNERWWQPSAEWIAEENRRDGVLPNTVRLVRTWIVHDELDESGAVDSGLNEFEFYVWTRP